MPAHKLPRLGDAPFFFEGNNTENNSLTSGVYCPNDAVHFWVQVEETLFKWVNFSKTVSLDS